MYTVKNLKINRRAFNNYRRNKHKLYKRLIAVVLAGSAFFGGIAYVAGKEQRQSNTIIEYYGENSVEKKILDYIDISEKLNKLKLYDYMTWAVELPIDEISQVKTTDEINKLIEEFESLNINKYDLSKQKQNKVLIMTLKVQQQLVNSYIFDTGYSVAHEDITIATKEYAAEVFGVDSYNRIKFKYTADSSSGDEIIYIDDTYAKEQYAMDFLFRTGKENDIRNGVLGMIDTDTSSDHDLTDNNKYNKLRNERIKDALEQSAILQQEVENRDLYDRNLANKMK